MKKVFAVIGILLVWANFICAAEELFFFCGAAVAVPMREIIKNYEQETGVKVNVTYSGSGTLLSQMELTKKGDVYLCGSPDYITIGVRRKLLIEETDKIISYLVPAILVPKENPKFVFRCLPETPGYATQPAPPSLTDSRRNFRAQTLQNARIAPLGRT